MIALGIDPGTAICGYGVVEEKNSHLTRSLLWGCDNNQRYGAGNALKKDI
jgi:Holliday junction resolvasome RuvABC endonuclease subunit